MNRLLDKTRQELSATRKLGKKITMKDYKELRIVFMGTPDFAVASLDKLISAGCNIVGVITAADKPAGRGMKLQQSAVKKYAAEKGLNILQPERLKNPDFIEELKSLQADLQAVVAFRMLPEAVWNMPPMGTVNVHASLLPQYRGAAPINWAIINGEKFTGVTTFKLQHEIDTGNILLSEKIEIQDEDNAGTVHDKLKETGADLLLKTIMGLADNTLTETAQVETGLALHHAPKLNNDVAGIDWRKTTGEVYNKIRGLSPYPGAFTKLNDKTIKIFQAEKIIESHNAKPGSYVSDGKTFLQYACANGYISIKELQPEGKKRMAIADFLRGYSFIKNKTSE